MKGKGTVKKFEELTKEEMQQEIKKEHDKMQDDFINKLNDDIQWLSEKANKKGYVLTANERAKIQMMINTLNWVNIHC